MWKISFFILLLSVESAICCDGDNATFSCNAGERKALLNFKASFVDPSNRLSSWSSTNNCCTWEGVTCDKITGHVIKLDVRNTKPNFDKNRLLSKQLDSSLLELKHLSYLDLSCNNFQLSPIPTFLGSMKQLQYLNLSSANFNGIVPHNLGNISSLRILDLSSRDSGLYLKVDRLMWASNLSSLKHLDISYVDLSRTKDLFQVLKMLPSVVVLRLSSSGLDRTHLPHACVNSSLLPNMRHLDLSSNSFDGEFPCFLHNMTSLRVLDLSNNFYNSYGPAHFLRLRDLVHLNLAQNSLQHKTDWITKFLSDKCHLESLNLADNQFYGEISGLFKNLSGCSWSQNLVTLNLGSNEFHGHVPEALDEFKQLNHLDISSNLFSGPIPTSLWKLRSLRYLWVNGNQLSGEIPISLGQLSNLVSIHLSFNSFNGTLSEAHFATLSKLQYLWVGPSLINFNMGRDWVPPFQLRALLLHSSKIEGQFPQWLQTQKALIHLHMLNCGISGTLPKWLHYVNLIELNLSDNHIEGPMPDSLCEMQALKSLDLSNNHLSGNLLDCWGNLTNLEDMRLSSNGLSGFISNSIGEAYSLQWLHLDKNNFTGQLPFTLKNCTKLIALDVGHNKLTGKLPEWIGKYFLSLSFLILRNNEFYGTIPFVFCQLSKLQIMDLSNNKLTGKIPRCFGNFSGMVKGHSNTFSPYESYYERLHQVIKGVDHEYIRISIYVVNLDLSNNNLKGEIPPELTDLSALIGFNLSHNHLAGKIPKKIGNLQSLESLDLSNNKLFGKIPHSLSNLSSLSHLNLSHNNLSGQIPIGKQLRTLEDPSIYDGNPMLCGAPLLKKCPDDGKSKSRDVENQGAADEGDSADDVYFYAVTISGFATGFCGIIGALIFKRSWREAYFRFMEVAISKMLGS